MRFFTDPKHRSAFRAGQAVALGLLFMAGFLLAPARAAEPTFQQILAMRKTTALLEHRGLVLRGLDGGGIIVNDRDNPQSVQRWTGGPDLSGNNITDMFWTGQHVWIATIGGGLTRVTDLETAPQFRQYTNNLGSLDVTAVVGTVVGDAERVFYGMAGDGLGQINSGLSGNIFTAEEDGLISNEVTALQIFDGDLFIGTPVGISRFANNIFTDQNTGLTSMEIHDLIVDSSGNLLAASNDGVHLWDPGAETWSLLVSLGAPVMDLASAQGKVYALGREPNSHGLLSEFDGSSWSPITLPYFQCSAIAAGEDLWVSGPEVYSTPGGHLTYNFLGRRLGGDQFDTLVDMDTQVANCEGVTFGADGSTWMGDFFGFQISRYQPADDSFLFLFERPHAANDTLNLFPGLGPVLSLAGATDGSVFAGQYAGGGVLKYNPASMTTDLMDPDNSGLQGRGVVNLVLHPDGPLIIMHDWRDTQNVEVLVDPDNWEGTAGWVLPPMDQGLGSGPTVWDAVAERRDVIWFAVEGSGLVRWDVNGPNAGPNDPVTWFDPTDDVWYDTVVDFPGTSLKPEETLGLAAGRDGTIWAGGNGLVQFTYELTGGTSLQVEVLRDYGEKSPASPVGLVNGNVKDVAVDGNGDIWVSTRTGLNRIHPVGPDGADIAAWIDLGNYLGNSTYGLIYSPNVIAPLPGNTYAKIAVSPDGRQLLLSADQGTTLINVGSGTTDGGTGSDPLAGVFCYPNPWHPGEMESLLKIGGLPGQSAEVYIYNIEGQQVYSDKTVAPDSGFWEGNNVSDAPVSTGLYLLRIVVDDAVTTRTLAVVR